MLLSSPGSRDPAGGPIRRKIEALAMDRDRRKLLRLKETGPESSVTSRTNHRLWSIIVSPGFPLLHIIGVLCSTPQKKGPLTQHARDGFMRNDIIGYPEGMHTTSTSTVFMVALFANEHQLRRHKTSPCYLHRHVCGVCV